MLQFLEELCALDGPSGCEDNVRDYIREKAAPYSDELREDPMGNLMVLRRGKGFCEKPLMVCAHMDEVGVIVKRITEEGMIKFGFVGGVDPRVVIGRKIRFTNGVRGVVGIKAVHLTTPAERENMPKTKDLYIDIGASGQAQAEARLSPGDYGTFDVQNRRFGDGLFKAKAIDDRIGCAPCCGKSRPLIPGSASRYRRRSGCAARQLRRSGQSRVSAWWSRAPPPLTSRKRPGRSRFAACAAAQFCRSWTAARFTTGSCSSCCAMRRRKKACAGRPSTWLPGARTRGASTRCSLGCGRSALPRRYGISIHR